MGEEYRGSLTQTQTLRAYSIEKTITQKKSIAKKQGWYSINNSYFVSRITTMTLSRISEAIK
jgi:hypothetical protein